MNFPGCSQDEKKSNLGSAGGSLLLWWNPSLMSALEWAGCMAALLIWWNVTHFFFTGSIFQPALPPGDLPALVAPPSSLARPRKFSEGFSVGIAPKGEGAQTWFSGSWTISLLQKTPTLSAKRSEQHQSTEALCSGLSEHHGRPAIIESFIWSNIYWPQKKLIFHYLLLFHKPRWQEDFFFLKGTVRWTSNKWNIKIKHTL